MSIRSLLKFFTQASFLLLILVSTNSFAQQKVAMVNLQEALNEVNQGKRAMAAIKSEYEAKKKQIDAMVKKIDEMAQDVQKKVNVLSKDALEAKRVEINQKLFEVKQKKEEYKAEIQKKEQESIQNILSSLRKVVIEMAKKEKYETVYENSASIILYSTNTVDITDQIVKIYNKKYK